jgi:hypothetical protein
MTSAAISHTEHIVELRIISRNNQFSVVTLSRAEYNMQG